MASGDAFDLDVAIVGGGPAGLATAAALLRAVPGVRLKVFEAAPAYREQGAGVLVQANGGRALEALDPRIMHRLVSVGTITSGMVPYNDTTGEKLPWVNGKNPMADLDAMGYANVLVLWNDIRRTLYDALPPGTVQFGSRVVEVAAPEPEPEGGDGGEGKDGHKQQPAQGCFTLRIADTGDAAAPLAAVRARHVVAADGYFSRTRRAFDGEAGLPAFHRTVLWRGSLSREEVAAAGSRLPDALNPALNPEGLRCTHFWSPATADKPPTGPPPRGIMLFPAGPLDPDTTASGLEGDAARIVWNVFFSVEDEAAADEADGKPLADRSIHTAGKQGGAALARCLAANTHLPEDLRALLAASPPERVTEHGLYKHPLEGFIKGAWARGRLVLLGDAAHTAPPDGQGVNLSLEDAVVLGALVRAHGLGPQAFSEWEAARQPRIAAILGDPTPQGSIRMPLIRNAAFEPLWSAEGLEAAGSLPPDVAAEARQAAAEAAAAAAEAEGEAAAEAAAAAERKAVLAWSRGEVRSLVLAKLEGRNLLVSGPRPDGMYLIR
ncbi:hypothetical protein HYH03_003311 [Edaphochlamys debaryana]|uniref:FAD-binding domain-containing protein n=1 Tax=Edaphochlamys debaryana TaxID=47281 RepID=A0A835YH30_9CHLO|nr:hypothetical protein HYH03_003311 [Edaphochlamys debaryana]|eukprot:KAG2498560.1 hypothetical protein HYH03_003311 [Edaphochlamys debaryana]